MDMRKVLIAMMMVLALTASTEMAAQKHRHTTQKELTDAGSKELKDSVGKDAVEVFSDTTSTAAPATQGTAGSTDEWDEDSFDNVSQMFTFDINSLRSKDVAGMLFVLAVLFILFVLAPVLIIIALFYFINKNRKEKIRLAQMAVQQGQPIPDQLLDDKRLLGEDDYQKGLRQCFVGVGLMIFLGYAAGEVGFGVGALVFCIGLGKIVAAKMSKNNNNLNNNRI
jgi:hypothetical protein